MSQPMVVLVIGNFDGNAGERLAQHHKCQLKKVEDTKAITHELLIRDEAIIYVVGSMNVISKLNLNEIARVSGHMEVTRSICFFTATNSENLRNKIEETITNECLLGKGKMVVADSLGSKIYGENVKYLSVVGGAQVWPKILQEDIPDVLLMTGHGNGLHLMGGDVVFCRREEAQTFGGQIPPNINLLPCFNGGECSFEQQGKIRFSIEALRAKRMLLFSCWGVPTTNTTPFSNDFATGYELINRLELKTLITTIAPTLTPPLIFNLAYYLTNMGLTFAELARKLNQFCLWVGLKPSFFCFGDGGARMSRTLMSSSTTTSIKDGRYHITPPDADINEFVTHITGKIRPQFLLNQTINQLDGLLTPWGDLFLTYKEKGRKKQERYPLTLEIKYEKGHLLTSTIEFLLEGLTFVEEFTTSFRKNKKSPDGIVLMHYIINTRMLLTTWPYINPIWGIVLCQQKIEQHMSIIVKRFSFIQSALTRMYREWIEVADVMPPYLFWKTFYNYISYKDSVKICNQCGNQITAESYEKKFNKGNRCIHICYSCGPVSDGPQIPLCEFEEFRIPNHDGIAHVKLSLLNPVQLSLNFSVTAVIKKFASKDVFEYTCEGVLASVERRSINLEIQMPINLCSGVYYIGVIAILGASPTFLRRVFVFEGRKSI